MENFAENVTQYLFEHEYVDNDQLQWCHYTIVHWSMSVLSFVVLVPIGAMIVGWAGSLLFTATFRFLRARTGGYHAKTPHGCLLSSLCLQTVFLFISKANTYFIATSLFAALSALLIFTLAPANNPKLHLTSAEIEALHPRILFRLCIALICSGILMYYNPLWCSCILLAIIAVAALLILSKCGCGTQ